jgi:hypothetical protein
VWAWREGEIREGRCFFSLFSFVKVGEGKGEVFSGFGRGQVRLSLTEFFGEITAVSCCCCCRGVFAVGDRPNVCDCGEVELRFTPCCCNNNNFSFALSLNCFLKIFKSSSSSSSSSSSASPSLSPPLNASSMIVFLPISSLICLKSSCVLLFAFRLPKEEERVLVLFR